MGKMLSVLFLMLGLVIGAMVGTIILEMCYVNKATKCAKQNNVYECEIIAVPKKGN